MKDLIDFALILSAASLMGIMISIIYSLTHSRAVYASKMTTLLVVASILAAMLLCLKFYAGGVALIGAAIIIRFRSPIKDHRDIVYILLAVISGFSCATHMYGAIGITIVLSVIVMCIMKANQQSDRVLMVVKGDSDHEEAIIEEIMNYNNMSLKMLNNNSNDEVGTELIYMVRNSDAPFSVANNIKSDLYLIDGINEVHILYQDDEMAI